MSIEKNIWQKQTEIESKIKLSDEQKTELFGDYNKQKTAAERFRDITQSTPIQDAVYQLGLKIRETETDFMLERIAEYGTIHTGMSISKETVKNALIQYMRKGRWIVSAVDVYNNGSILEKWYKCPECGYETALDIPRNYCPECGADMRGDEHG